MEQQSNHIETLFEKAGDYLETRMEITKLKTAEKSSDVISLLVTRLILIAFSSFILIMLNIGLGLYLGSVLGKNYYGFFVLTGFYLIIGTLFYLFRNKWIREPISNAIIKKIAK